MNDFGKITFIKDGKYDCKYYENLQTDMESMYQDADKMLADGYTVVINTNKSSSLSKFYSSEFFVSENIKPQDYIIIMGKVKRDIKERGTIYITNYCSRNGYLDYDYYDYSMNIREIIDDMDATERFYCQKNNEDRTPDRILDLFLRKKLNGLTPKEEKMYQIYEEFNLENILYEDSTKLDLNNKNSGVITIFKDETYKSTVTKMSHKSEHQQHINAYTSANKSSVEKDNVYIQLTNNYVSFVFPEEINDYQKDQLNDFLKELEDIQLLKGNVKVYGVVKTKKEFSDITEEFVGIDQIKQHVKQTKSKK